MPDAVCEVTTARGGAIVDIVVTVVDFEDAVVLACFWVSKTVLLLLLLRDPRMFLNGLDIYRFDGTTVAEDWFADMRKM